MPTMYKAKLWDEDKWDIHSDSYSSSKYTHLFSNNDDKKDDVKYHEQKYGFNEKNISSDYLRKEDAREKEDDKSIFEELEEKKDFGNNDAKEEEIAFKAARNVFDENNTAKKSAKTIFLPDDKERSNLSTIEDAIKKAIEEEKKVIIMDS